jgi:translocation and assembly module TamB
MSEPEINSVPSSPAPGWPQAERRSWRSRLRRFFLRHLPLTVAGAVVLLLLLAVAGYFIASSSAFENAVRKRMIAEIETATGGRAEIASFHWRLLHLQAEADGIVIHGLEDPGDAPYVQIDRLRARASILDVFSPRILLRDLDISHPQVHLIVYPDGSTNQPHPLRRARPSESAFDKLFDLQAGHVAVDGGVLHYDCRAASFDFQNRYAPLDFEADDVSLVMLYMPWSLHAPEFYRIEVQAAQLNLARTVPRKQPLPVEGNLKAAVDLERSRIVLRSLDLVAHRKGDESHTLHIAGELDDLNHPHWQAKVTGDLDMRLLDPVFGYPDAPEGIARLQFAATGDAHSFHIDGPIHIDKGSYLGAGMNARGVTLDAQIRADQKRLQIDGVVARLAQGGQVEGAVDLQPWLLSAPAATVERTYANPQERRAARNTLVRSAPPTIPVNGKVTANFKNVSLDTLLDVVAAPPYRRLGLDALVNGPALASWSYGEAGNVSVTARLALSPSGHALSGEAPTSGIIDATYTQRNGGVDLRNLELRLPGSEIQAHGALGAYPVTRPSSLSMDLRSTNLADFDAALRSLGLKRNGKTGAAALPVALSGQAEFHGTWSGSLVRPQIAGSLKATQLGLEMPSQEMPGQNSPGRETLAQQTPTQSAAPGQPRMLHPSMPRPSMLHFDSVEVDGSYSPAQVAIRRADLVRGKSRITISGTLEASTVPSSRYAAPMQAFDADSLLHLRAEGTAVDFADVQPFLGANSSIPISGEFNTQIDLEGPVHSPEGSGWLDMERATIFGEPVTRVSLHGLVKDRVLRLTSATLEDAGGVVTVSGSYAFTDKRFNVDAHAERIDVAQIGWLHQRDLDVKGKLGITVTGSGTLDDPRLDGTATVTALTLGGQQFGALDVSAHSASHIVNYTLNTQLQGAALSVRGATQLSAGYDTHAQLDFSSFNIDALFAMANLQAFRGQSALAGTITVAGPLARPRELTGEARLNELAMTIAGVPLKSEGGAHATLAAGRVQLDPLHITGADTDLHLQGSLSLEGARQLDLSSSGSVNLKLAETLDPDLTARGTTTFKVDARGPLLHPDLEGRVELQDGSLSLGDLPNGLSQLRGSLEFNQDRLEVQSLTAMSGGGQLSVSGYLAYQRGIYADLSVTGKGVRIRYPQGVTSLADAKFQLQGAQSNLLLSGDVLITRFTANPDLDLAALAAQSGPSVQTIAPPDAPSNHVRLDVHIVSSPQLNFQNAFAKLAGDVDVHLRGTLASPSILGRIDITQGSAMIAGTRYDLERGEITFTNPLRIEPTIDMSATARVEDYDITLGLNGPPQKLAVTYRSDPPLPEADVVSLLALGHTANQQRLYTQQQQQAISNSTDALLGGALSATVSSRIQKLFGAGSVKLDPDYLGAFGNSTSRITVQEQLGRDITLTYATDVNTTSQQLLQAEVAINRHVSLVVARDESGVFSLVIKATRRYR